MFLLGELLIAFNRSSAVSGVITVLSSISNTIVRNVSCLAVNSNKFDI